MNNTTEGVTLYSGFLFAILGQYREHPLIASHLRQMTANLDPSNPTQLAPMQLYNDMCDWIEKKLGQSSIRRAGFAIGDAAYDQMCRDGKLSASPSPNEILAELKRVASLMIQDPLGRGWEIVESSPGKVLLRRTQTFNCILQEGLLSSLVARTGALLAHVKHVRCTRSGDPFCEYLVTWLVQ